MSMLSIGLLAAGIGVALLAAARFRRQATPAKRSAGAIDVVAVEPPAAEDAIPAHHLVALAAAAHALLGSSLRIVHIEDAHRGRVWTSAARTAHYASHKLPRHRH